MDIRERVAAVVARYEEGQDQWKEAQALLPEVGKADLSFDEQVQLEQKLVEVIEGCE